jgi:hypothetical protein
LFCISIKRAPHYPEPFSNYAFAVVVAATDKNTYYQQYLMLLKSTDRKYLRLQLILPLPIVGSLVLNKPYFVGHGYKLHVGRHRKSHTGVLYI